MSQPVFPHNVDSATRMHHDGHPAYWFYHRDSFPSAPPLLYQQLISSATSSIDIWDPYFNVSAGTVGDAMIFTSVQPQITIKILTTKGMTKGRPYLGVVENAIKQTIPPRHKVRFGLRVVDIGDTNMENYLFHDRMLIIDNTDFYLVGSSVGYHLTVQCSTGIYRVNDQMTQTFIQQLFDHYWSHAIKHQIPVKNLHL